MDNIIIAIISLAGTVVVALITALFANRKSLKLEVGKQMELLIKEYKDERDLLKQESREEREQLKEEINQLKEEINSLQTAYHNLLTRFDEETELVSSLRKRIRALEAERNDLLDRLRTVEAENIILRERLNHREDRDSNHGEVAPS